MIQTQSAGGVVINKNGLILVVNQRGHSWSLPKGHIEDGEDNLTAAKREIYEESGVTHLELVKELGSYQRYKPDLDVENGKSELKTIYLFLFKTDQEQLNPIDGENPKARWIEKHKVADLLTRKEAKKFFLSIIDKI